MSTIIVESTHSHYTDTPGIVVKESKIEAPVDFTVKHIEHEDFHVDSAPHGYGIRRVMQASVMSDREREVRD